MRARLLRSYVPQYPQPIAFAAGDVVRLGARDSEWPAFAWVTTADGNAGWAPHAWLRPRDDGHAVALRDYIARELHDDAGQAVTLHHELGGWWWSERADGALGWLPGRDLERIDGTPP